VARFVFLSSVKVNGEATSGEPVTEDDTPAPEDAYATSKWEAEQALAEASGGGIETVVLRTPLVYGPGVKANFLSLLKLCDTALPLPLGGIDGNRRSLIYLGNLADALRRALVHGAAAGRTYLVRDREDVSTAGLVRRIRRALGRPPRLVTVPTGALRAALAVTGRRAAADRLLGSLAVDAGRIDRELGWTPPYTMDQGLHATVSWYRGAAP
jgi:nucleoside-diphosphate-sugar epimerase